MRMTRNFTSGKRFKNFTRKKPPYRCFYRIRNFRKKKCNFTQLIWLQKDSVLKICPDFFLTIFSLNKNAQDIIYILFNCIIL